MVDAGPTVDLAWVLDDLHGRGVRRLMVEGGRRVLTQLLAQGLADELQLVVAPVFVGDPRAPRFVDDGPFPFTPSDRARLAEVRQVGDAALLRYALTDRCRELAEEVTVPTTLPRATIRTQVTIPLRLADGYATTARAFTFDGLVDGREHLALGLGRVRGARCAMTRTADPRPAAQRVPHRRRPRHPSAATAAPSCARRSAGSTAPAGTCCTCARRAAASASTPSSTPTSCRARASTRMRPTSPSGTPPTSATTPPRPRCCSRSGYPRSGC